MIFLFSEGGTEEDRRIDPPLNFGIFIENNNKIWKKWLRSSPRLIKKNSDPPLDKFRSALTAFGCWNRKSYWSFFKFLPGWVVVIFILLEKGSAIEMWATKTIGKMAKNTTSWSANYYSLHLFSIFKAISVCRHRGFFFIFNFLVHVNFTYKDKW